MKQLSRSIPAEVRFGLNVSIQENGCWLWLGGKSRNGYGMINVHAKQMMAHRASWLFHRGPIPEGLLVCHKCDTPPCVNPEHLFLGTAKDNAQDSVKKGRWARNLGEQNGAAKLTEAQAAAIRQQSSRPIRELAQEYGISIWTIYDIRSGRSRKPSAA